MHVNNSDTRDLKANIQIEQETSEVPNKKETDETLRPQSRLSFAHLEPKNGPLPRIVLWHFMTWSWFQAEGCDSI